MTVATDLLPQAIQSHFGGFRNRQHVSRLKFGQSGGKPGLSAGLDPSAGRQADLRAGQTDDARPFVTENECYLIFAANGDRVTSEVIEAGDRRLDKIESDRLMLVGVWIEPAKEGRWLPAGSFSGLANGASSAR